MATRAIQTRKKPRLPPQSQLSERKRKRYCLPEGVNTFCGACCMAAPGCDKKCPLRPFKHPEGKK